MSYSIAEIAARLGVEAKLARGLVHFLVSIGLVEPRGERRTSKGRPERIYAFADDFEERLFARMRGANLAGG